MIGAIAGDIAGSRFESCPPGSKDFPLFSSRSRFTDDTVLTCAAAKAVAECASKDFSELDKNIRIAYRDFGKRYPRCGFGGGFMSWFRQEKSGPFTSRGNGAAMSVSPMAWAFSSLMDVEEAAKVLASVTHGSKEGIAGAQATAAAIFLARAGMSKDDIKGYIESRFGYFLDQTASEMRDSYKSYPYPCPPYETSGLTATNRARSAKSVPEAITCFLIGRSFEEVIRTAICLGGDTDTQAAIAGSIAEAYYCVPDSIRNEAWARLDDNLRAVIAAFEAKFPKK
jgi:ADP-ribosylglycohydrolase